MFVCLVSCTESRINQSVQLVSSQRRSDVPKQCPGGCQHALTSSAALLSCERLCLSELCCLSFIHCLWLFYFQTAINTNVFISPQVISSCSDRSLCGSFSFIYRVSPHFDSRASGDSIKMQRNTELYTKTRGGKWNRWCLSWVFQNLWT